MLVGVRPACLGMIGGVLVSLGLSNYSLPNGSVSIYAVLLGLLDLLLMIKGRLSVPKVIGISAALGLLLF